MGLHLAGVGWFRRVASLPVICVLIAWGVPAHAQTPLLYTLHIEPVPNGYVTAQWEVVGVGDMNGDGWLDLVWRHYGNGGLAAWLMRDTSVVQTVRLAPASATDTDWRIVGAADVNRDGQTDLVWQHRTDGRLAVWYMDGTTRVHTSLLNPSVVSDLNWRVVGVK